jgi:hypothetical protein
MELYICGQLTVLPATFRIDGSLLASQLDRTTTNLVVMRYFHDAGEMVAVMAATLADAARCSPAFGLRA